MWPFGSFILGVGTLRGFGATRRPGLKELVEKAQALQDEADGGVTRLFRRDAGGSKSKYPIYNGLWSQNTIKA